MKRNFQRNHDACYYFIGNMNEILPHFWNKRVIVYTRHMFTLKRIRLFHEHYFSFGRNVSDFLRCDSEMRG